MKIRYILLGLPLMAACSDIEPVATPETVGTTAVVISDTFGDTKASVRAEAYTETVPSESAKLLADIWYSTTMWKYPGNTYGTKGVSDDGLSIDAHRTITYQGPSITNSDLTGDQKAIKYPAGKTLYSVGLYPQGKWKPIPPDSTQAQATVDGIQDLMYAPQISGTQADPLSAKAQQFAHQLCWIKIRLRSRDLTAGETWGKVDTVQIKTLPTAEVDFENGNVTFSGTETYLTVLDSAATGGMKMPIMSTEVGSVMVSPITASPYEYTVRVVCQHHTKEVTVPLTNNTGTAYTGNTAGKVFVITLYFSPLSTIEFTASLSNWEDEARSLTLN